MCDNFHWTFASTDLKQYKNHQNDPIDIWILPLLTEENLNC